MDLFLFRAEMKPTIRPMRIREAKDFLVAPTAEQATLEVGSEEARFRAGLRPPLKLHGRFSRMQLSRRLTTSELR
jgi:hypothetical protein